MACHFSLSLWALVLFSWIDGVGYCINNKSQSSVKSDCRTRVYHDDQRHEKEHQPILGCLTKAVCSMVGTVGRMGWQTHWQIFSAVQKIITTLYIWQIKMFLFTVKCYIGIDRLTLPSWVSSRSTLFYFFFNGSVVVPLNNETFWSFIYTPSVVV